VKHASSAGPASARGRGGGRSAAHRPAAPSRRASRSGRWANGACAVPCPRQILARPPSASTSSDRADAATRRRRRPAPGLGRRGCRGGAERHKHGGHVSLGQPRQRRVSWSSRMCRSSRGRPSRNGRRPTDDLLQLPVTCPTGGPDDNSLPRPAAAPQPQPRRRRELSYERHEPVAEMGGSCGLGRAPQANDGRCLAEAEGPVRLAKAAAPRDLARNSSATSVSAGCSHRCPASRS